MNMPTQPKQTQNLLKDLLGELSSVASASVKRSLGVVGPAITLPQPPGHCLQTCLDGEADRMQTSGCLWLLRAAAGRLDPSRLENGRCPRGFHVAAQPIRINENTGFLLAVEGAAASSSPDETAGVSEDRVLGELESLSRVFEQVGQLLDENEGLAHEVLRGYEQLNLLFDFTQKIASLTDVEAIEKVLLGRLGGLLAAKTMLVIEPNGKHRCYDVARDELLEGRAPALTRQLSGEIEAVRRSRTVSVHSCPAARVLLGPLVRLDDRIDTVLVVRPPDADEFTSGDMLMSESVLSFGGQIISNSEIHERLRHMSLESTRALVAAIDKKDHYTCGHSERVGFLTRLTGQRMGIPPAELRLLEMAALLHDVGKIGVPEEILRKPGRLTDEEFDVIKKHPVMGYEILKPIASFGGVMDGVLYHHENPDGSGYPKGLSGTQIPLFARIIHVIDVFDALTSDRSYRAAYSFEQACEILRKEAGTRLASEVTAVFLELLPAYWAEHAEGSAAVLSAEREAIDAEA